MLITSAIDTILTNHVIPDNHPASDYFSAIKQLVKHRQNADTETEKQQWQHAIDDTYSCVRDEITNNTDQPVSTINPESPPHPAPHSSAPASPGTHRSQRHEC